MFPGWFTVSIIQWSRLQNSDKTIPTGSYAVSNDIFTDVSRPGRTCLIKGDSEARVLSRHLTGCYFGEIGPFSESLLTAMIEEVDTSVKDIRRQAALA